jgi:hypothetical protein
MMVLMFACAAHFPAATSKRTMSVSEPYTADQIAENEDATTGDTLGENEKIDSKVMDSRSVIPFIRLCFFCSVCSHFDGRVMRDMA